MANGGVALGKGEEMTEPMSDEYAYQIMSQNLFGVDKVKEIFRLRAEVERLMYRNNSAEVGRGCFECADLSDEIGRIRDKLKAHEEALREVHAMMKRQRELNQKQMDETIEPSPEEDILRARLEEK